MLQFLLFELSPAINFTLRGKSANHLRIQRYLNHAKSMPSLLLFLLFGLSQAINFTLRGKSANHLRIQRYLNHAKSMTLLLLFLLFELSQAINFTLRGKSANPKDTALSQPCKEYAFMFLLFS